MKHVPWDIHTVIRPVDIKLVRILQDPQTHTRASDTRKTALKTTWTLQSTLKNGT